MKLIVISPSISKENEIEQIVKMFEIGLETYHLRKPKYSTRKLRDYINQIPVHFHNRIIIHSHHQLAFNYDLQGIHLTFTHRRRKFSLFFLRLRIKLLKPALQITASFRSLASVYDETNKNKYNYIFLSPIFDSLSGKFQSGFNDYSLRSAIGKSSLKVVARGGTDITSIQKVKEIQFYGIAFYSSIWKAENPVLELHKILDKFKELGIKLE